LKKPGFRVVENSQKTGFGFGKTRVGNTTDVMYTYERSYCISSSLIYKNIAMHKINTLSLRYLKFANKNNSIVQNWSWREFIQSFPWKLRKCGGSKDGTNGTTMRKVLWNIRLSQGCTTFLLLPMALRLFLRITAISVSKIFFIFLHCFCFASTPWA